MIKKDTLYDINTIYYTIGRNLKKVYDNVPKKDYENGVSKAEYYAEQLDISTSYFYHILSGKQEGQEFSFRVLINICNVFNVPIEKLMRPLSDDEYEKFYLAKSSKKKRQ